jgi:hypothetical protein
LNKKLLYFGTYKGVVGGIDPNIESKIKIQEIYQPFRNRICCIRTDPNIIVIGDVNGNICVIDKNKKASSLRDEESQYLRMPAEHQDTILDI